jgi:hypothetical protein
MEGPLPYLGFFSHSGDGGNFNPHNTFLILCHFWWFYFPDHMLTDMCRKCYLLVLYAWGFPRLRAACILHVCAKGPAENLRGPSVVFTEQKGIE